MGKLYLVVFISGKNKTYIAVRNARNKPEAIAEAFVKLGSWRAKDRVDSIDIIEDMNNPEATIDDYR
ncbi:hypothetical protein ACVWZB_004778 [Paenibacillus polymyxa]